MDIFSMFKGQQQQAAPQQQQQQQQDYKQTGGGAAPQQQEQQQNPLDSFSSIWQNASKEGQQDQAKAGPESYGVKIDDAAIRGAASKIDFVKEVPQELLQKATQGDIGALLQVINGVGQMALAHSTQINGNMLNHSLSSGFDKFGNTLQDKFKDFSTRDRVYSAGTEEAKVLSHPAIQPLVETARRQILQNNPAATSAEVEQQLVSYFKQVGTAFGGGQQSQQSSQPNGQASDKMQDFSNFFK